MCSGYREPAGCSGSFLCGKHRGLPPMKPIRLVLTPTRNRRLNEVIGLVLLVGSGLLFLALLSYRPTDPSLNTVGGYGTGRLAHNWVGVAGATTSDLLLQAEGIAAFVFPLLLGALGWSWLRSRPAGSPMAKALGVLLITIFLPALLRAAPRASLLVTRPADRRPLRQAGGRLAGRVPELPRRRDRDRQHGGRGALSLNHFQLQHRAGMAGDSRGLLLCLARSRAQLAGGPAADARREAALETRGPAGTGFDQGAEGRGEKQKEATCATSPRRG